MNSVLTWASEKRFGGEIWRSKKLIMQSKKVTSRRAKLKKRKHFFDGTRKIKIKTNNKQCEFCNGLHRSAGFSMISNSEHAFPKFFFFFLIKMKHQHLLVCFWDWQIVFYIFLLFMINLFVILSIVTFYFRLMFNLYTETMNSIDAHGEH